MEKEEPTTGIPEFHQGALAPSHTRLHSPTRAGQHYLAIPRTLYLNTMRELRARSAGWRESAAIWSGSIENDKWTASTLHLHHQMGSPDSGPLFLELTQVSKFQLYQRLQPRGEQLIALIHTHPAGWVELSKIDQANQLSSRVGFWSLVVPHYGNEPWEIETIGIHERCPIGWRQLPVNEIESRVKITED